MRNVLLGILAAIGVLLGFGVIGGVEMADARPAPTVTVTATPTGSPAESLYRSIFDNPATPDCQEEDGSELAHAADVGRTCRWDAGSAGNGVGDSFVVLVTPVADGGVQLLYLYADGHFEL